MLIVRENEHEFIAGSDGNSRACATGAEIEAEMSTSHRPLNSR